MILKNNQGFSLVEVLVALVILAVGILAVAGLQVTSIRGNAYSHRATVATALGEGQLEILQGLDYDDPLLNPGGHTPLVQDQYTLVWTVTEDSSLTNTKTIQIVVFWNEGETKSVTLTTMKSGA